MELCEAVTRTPAARPLRRTAAADLATAQAYSALSFRSDSSEPAKKWRATARTGAGMVPQVVMLAGAR